MKKKRCLNDLHLPNPNAVFLILLLGLTICSCKKEPSFIDLNGRPSSLQQVFISFWDKMNRHYVYWDKEATDWNLAYTQYKPLFDQLSNNNEGQKKAILYFKQMTSNLLDHHFTISFQEPLLFGSVINPALERKITAKNYHVRYNYNNIIKSYLDKGFLSGKGNILVNGETVEATVGTIDQNLLYFHCNFFVLKQSYDSTNDNKIKQILIYFFSSLKRMQEPIKGIILDLRGNSGGNIEDLNFFAGKLIIRDIIFGYSRSKNGMGKLSYSPWLESKLKHDPDYSKSIPIMLLGDNFSASLSETMIIALKSKTNLFIGEQTYGATGPLSDTNIFNSGSFTVGDFMKVNTSSVEFKGIDGTFYEGTGITPDIYSLFNIKELSAGKDLQLELAIDKLK